VKLSSTGAIQWQKCLGGSGTDIAYSIQQTIDAGYIVAGTSYSVDGDVTGNHGGGDYWLVKLKTCDQIAMAAISGNTTICNGQSTYLSANSADSYLWSNGSTDQSITVSNGGIYTVTTTISGCSASASAAVTVTSLATPVVSSNSPVASGSIISLYSNTISGATYQWSHQYGLFSSNQQNPVIANATIANSGIYTLTVTKDGCYTQADISVVVNDATAVYYNKYNTFQVNVQPNPFVESATLNVESTKSENLEIVVFDVAGRIIEKQQLLLAKGNQAVQICKNAPQGTYIIRLSNTAGETLTSFQVVKQQ